MPARKLKMIWSNPKEKEQVYFRYDPYGNRLARIGCCPPTQTIDPYNFRQFLVVDVNKPTSAYPQNVNYFGFDLGSAPPYIKFALGTSAPNDSDWITNMVNNATTISVSGAGSPLDFAIYRKDFVISAGPNPWTVAVTVTDSNGTLSENMTIDLAWE